MFSVIVGTFGNTLILLAIIKNSCLQTVPDLFIFSLAIADLLVTVLIQPLWIYKVNNLETAVYFEKKLLYLVLRGICYLSLLASITNVFAVTVDRYLAICRPFRYLSLVTKKRAVLVILTVWVNSAVIAVAGIFDKYYVNFYSFVYSVVLLVLTIIIYIYLLVVAKKQQNKIVTLNDPSNGNNGDTSLPSRQKREQKAARTIAIVVGVFIVCWSPFLVITGLARVELKIMSPYVFFSFALCNSAINPYIYCVRNSRYREAFKKLLGRSGNNQINPVGGERVVPNEIQIQPRTPMDLG
jgi:histamine receptor H2